MHDVIIEGFMSQILILAKNAPEIFKNGIFTFLLRTYVFREGLTGPNVKKECYSFEFFLEIAIETRCDVQRHLA